MFEAARAIASLDRRSEVTIEDIQIVAPMALRMRRSEYLDTFFTTQESEERAHRRDHDTSHRGPIMTHRADRIGIAGLLLAWLGLWGAWVTHRVVSLRQNALDFAEWATYLPVVRSGEITLMPDILRLGVALAVIRLSHSRE